MTPHELDDIRKRAAECGDPIGHLLDLCAACADRRTLLDVVDRLTLATMSENDYLNGQRHERARILAAVRWMDKERCYTNGVHEDWHLRLAAVIAAIEGEE